MIKRGRITEQTSLTVAINVHLTVFLMGYLIKNLLVAAGLLSHPITAPPCQNLCHWPSPTLNTSLVSHMTSVSQGPVMECCSPRYSSAGTPRWPPSICSHADAVAEWPVAGWGVGRASEVKDQGTMVGGNWCSCFPSQPTAYTGWKSSPFTTLPPTTYPPNQAHPPPYQIGEQCHVCI